MKRLLELRNKRAEAVKEARGILDKADAETRDLTEQEETQYSDLATKIGKLNSEIEREERLSEVESRVRQVDTPRAKTTLGTQEQTDPDLTGGFRSLGEFIESVVYKRRDPRLESRVMTMATGSEGGFLVPKQFSDNLMAFSPEEALVRPRAMVLPAGDNPDAALEIPALAQGSDGVFGGVTVTWTGEGDTMTETDANLELVTVQPNEVTAYVVLTQKLLRNSAAASTIIERLLRQAIAASEDYNFLRGDGVAKPLGMLNSTAKINVSRNTSSAIKYDDIIGMEAKMLPEAKARSIWVASQSAYTQVKDVKDGSGNRIFTEQNLVKGYPNTLDGIPLYFTGRLPVLGNEGDLMLVDPSYYLVKDGFGPAVALSEHVHFTSNKVILKIVRSVDGQPWAKSPLELEDGSTTVSPFVILK